MLKIIFFLGLFVTISPLFLRQPPAVGGNMEPPSNATNATPPTNETLPITNTTSGLPALTMNETKLALSGNATELIFSLEINSLPEGDVLTDGSGFVLYVFGRDTKGESTCYGACADYWPPFLIRDLSDVDFGTLDISLFGIINRKDGSKQLTMKNKPLYYFHEDMEPGDTGGQGLIGFGNRWWLVDGTGEVVTNTEPRIY